MSAYQQFLSASLYDYVRANSLDDNDLYLREELAIAKHTMGALLQMYSRTLGATEVNDVQRLSLVNSVGESIRKGMMDISRLAKTIVEIESILASKFNGVQVLSAVEQITQIISQEFGQDRAVKFADRLKRELVVLHDADENKYALDQNEFLAMLHSVPNS